MKVRGSHIRRRLVDLLLVGAGVAAALVFFLTPGGGVAKADDMMSPPPPPPHNGGGNSCSCVNGSCTGNCPQPPPPPPPPPAPAPAPPPPAPAPAPPPPPPPAGHNFTPPPPPPQHGKTTRTPPPPPPAQNFQPVVPGNPTGALAADPVTPGPAPTPLDDPTLVAAGTPTSKGGSGAGTAAGVALGGLGLIAAATTMAKPKGSATALPPPVVAAAAEPPPFNVDCFRSASAMRRAMLRAMYIQSMISYVNYQVTSYNPNVYGWPTPLGHEIGPDRLPVPRKTLVYGTGEERTIFDDLNRDLAAAQKQQQDYADRFLSASPCGDNPFLYGIEKDTMWEPNPSGGGFQPRDFPQFVGNQWELTSRPGIPNTPSGMPMGI